MKKRKKEKQDLAKLVVNKIKYSQPDAAIELIRDLDRNHFVEITREAVLHDQPSVVTAVLKQLGDTPKTAFDQAISAALKKSDPGMLDVLIDSNVRIANPDNPLFTAMLNGNKKMIERAKRFALAPILNNQDKFKTFLDAHKKYINGDFIDVFKDTITKHDGDKIGTPAITKAILKQGDQEQLARAVIQDGAYLTPASANEREMDEIDQPESIVKQAFVNGTTVTL